jgi:hypothetical protein
VKKQTNVVLTGYVTPTSWDSGQNIRGISLLTTDHEEIKIVHTKKGDRLLSLVWEKVELTGKLENDRGGRKRIIVTNYRAADFDSLAGDEERIEDADLDEDLRDLFGNDPRSQNRGDLELPRGG